MKKTLYTLLIALVLSLPSYASLADDDVDTESNQQTQTQSVTNADNLGGNNGTVNSTSSARYCGTGC